MSTPIRWKLGETWGGEGEVKLSIFGYNNESDDDEDDEDDVEDDCDDDDGGEDGDEGDLDVGEQEEDEAEAHEGGRQEVQRAVPLPLDTV